MELKRRGTVYAALIAALLAISTNVRADHATNFLNALHQSITNQLATNDNLSRPEERALANAARTLERDSATLPADLKLLATASGQLKAKFSSDETLSELQNDAVENYSDTAHVRLSEVGLWVGTNAITKALSNEILKAGAALDRAASVSNGVPSQARSLAQAFTKILAVEKKVRSQYSAPVVVTPPPPPPPDTNSIPDYVPPRGCPGGHPWVGARHLWHQACGLV
jgi:hypothetical protein